MIGIARLALTPFLPKPAAKPAAAGPVSTQKPGQKAEPKPAP
jgi:hypothetical protein